MSESYYDRQRDLYHIPHGDVVDTLDPNGRDVLIEGTIMTLVGKARTVSGSGQIRLVLDATVNSIYKYVYVQKIMGSKVINIDDALVDEIEDCRVTNIWGTSRVAYIADSQVELIAGSTTVDKVSDSVIEEIGGSAAVHKLYLGTHVYQAVSDCRIGAANANVIVDVATDRAVLRNFHGTVRSARGEAHVALGNAGHVYATGGRATTLHAPTIPYGWAASCRPLPGGRIMVYKATPPDAVTGEQYGEPTKWEPGKTMTTDGRGFHFSPTITDTIDWLFNTTAEKARFFECAVDADSVDPITETNGNAPRIEVLREVDRRGNPIKEEE